MIYAINKLTKEHRLVKCVDENWDDEWQYVVPYGRGWIRHDGRACPLPDRHPVDIRYRCGGERFGLPANTLAETGDGDGVDASIAFWIKDQSPYDIIAYRPVFTTEEESEMNIEWDGDGLPPVGHSVEVLHDGRWIGATAVGAFGDHQTCMVCAPDGGGFYGFYPKEIRPVRSAEDKAVEEMGGLYEDGMGPDDFAKRLYQAGYRKMDTFIEDK